MRVAGARVRKMESSTMAGGKEALSNQHSALETPETSHENLS
jgi:hypothetical protein